MALGDVTGPSAPIRLECFLRASRQHRDLDEPFVGGPLLLRAQCIQAAARAALFGSCARS
jgi:hypothetical protein